MVFISSIILCVDMIGRLDAYEGPTTSRQYPSGRFLNSSGLRWQHGSTITSPIEKIYPLDDVLVIANLYFRVKLSE